LVGEDRNASDVLANLYGGSVQGYYSPARDSIVVVSDAKRPSIDRGTLAHELVHALQDQHFGMPPSGKTQDAQLAHDGLVEGDARYVEQLYQQRCSAGWQCVPNPPGGSGGSSIDMGVFVTVYTPYSEGPTLVDRLRQRGGWAAVNAAYDDPPASTEQVLHPRRYPGEKPVPVDVPDRSGPSWSRFDVHPQADTVGEASLFATFWANGVVAHSHLYQHAGPYSAYNYTASVTNGWAGDAVVPYRSADGEYGYVFRTKWDTTADAREFTRTYANALLVKHLDARQVSANTYVVDSGPFADAFRVVRDGETVTVVNAPTVEQLDGVYRP
ncbi:MAG: Hvo_1808 family surface protein, partial [Salinigranum sp.]